MRFTIFLFFTGLLLGEKLVPAERGVPPDLGGDVRLEQRGAHLWFAARLPEPAGKVLARSIGRNPVWEKDAVGSPEVEDRVRWQIRYKASSGLQRDVSIEANPWGAYRVEEGGEVTPDLGIIPSAEVTAEGWNIEATLPLKALDIDWNSAAIEWRGERIRSRRTLAPEFRWQWPAGSEFVSLRLAKNSDAQPPQLRPLPLGNTEPALEIGRVLRVPAVVAEWDDAAWQGIPAFELGHRTQIKWTHDGRTLAILARMEETDPVVARAGGRDSAVAGDDHVAIHLATTGSAFLEIAVNPVGAIRDSQRKGPRITQPRASWNANIETQASIRHGHWIARINIPLDECAAALNETGIPKHWRILIASHRASRPGEPGEWSARPVIDGSSSFYGPQRYQAMVLRDEDPTRVKLPEAFKREPKQGLQGDLTALDSGVWPPLYRRTRAVRTMVQDYLRRKVEHAVLAERFAWEKVQTRADWERFRNERIAALKEWVGKFPAVKPALQAQVTARRDGDGYRLENVVFQVRPGYWMAANLYLPATTPKNTPAIIIVPSQHYPKTQGELHDMGEIWARAGSAVLIVERPGYGERAETTPYYRQGYGSRFNFTRQLFLVGESYSGWAAWDVVRSVDFLYERPEIDKDRIILLGSVAGGGEIAGMAAALDARITAVAPYNYDQGHVRVHGDLPGQIGGQFSPWLISASVAPRKFIRAFEFGWEGAEEPDYPNLWFDGMQRSQKVWGFYNAAENLASVQAYGLIRLSMERVSHCFSIGPQQRSGLYPLFQRWFNMAYPSQKDLSILPDSDLSTNPDREEARRQEATRRRPHAELVSITPAVSAQLKRRAMHQVAFDMGKEQLEAARSRRQALAPQEKLAQLRKELKPMLGDIEPVEAAQAESFWKRSLAGAEVEALSVKVEDGIDVPLLLLTPLGKQPAPVVIAIAQPGKERFLANRASEIATLLAAGIAVCLPDVRGTGETAPATERTDGGAFQRIAQTEFDLGRNLLGSRLKDLRTVIAHLRQRNGIDRQRIALWGDSFTLPNAGNLRPDDREYDGGPQVQRQAEPMGAHLALLAALYEDGVLAVVARGGLASYLSVLENAFAYVPIEEVVFGVLKAGDVGDIAAALAPRPLVMERLVNGRNILVDASLLQQTLETTREAYRKADASKQLTVRVEPQDISAWLVAHLK